VPADPSFPIPSRLTPLRDADPLQQAETPHLLAYLATIPDPRAPRGHRHPLIAILAMAAAALLAGARSQSRLAGRGTRVACANGAGLDQRAGAAGGVGSRDHPMALLAGAASAGYPLAPKEESAGESVTLRRGPRP
jgi:hypothetical protein